MYDDEFELTFDLSDEDEASRAPEPEQEPVQEAEPEPVAETEPAAETEPSAELVPEPAVSAANGRRSHHFLHDLGCERCPGSVFDECHSTVLEIVLYQSCDKVIHERINTCIIGGGCKNQLGVAESITDCQ